MKTLLPIAFIAVISFAAGYIYRDNTYIRTLEIQIQWPTVNEADIDRVASR